MCRLCVRLSVACWKSWDLHGFSSGIRWLYCWYLLVMSVHLLFALQTAVLTKQPQLDGDTATIPDGDLDPNISNFMVHKLFDTQTIGWIYLSKNESTTKIDSESWFKLIVSLEQTELSNFLDLSSSGVVWFGNELLNLSCHWVAMMQQRRLVGFPIQMTSSLGMGQGGTSIYGEPQTMMCYLFVCHSNGPSSLNLHLLSGTSWSVKPATLLAGEPSCFIRPLWNQPITTRSTMTGSLVINHCWPPIFTTCCALQSLPGSSPNDPGEQIKDQHPLMVADGPAVVSRWLLQPSLSHHGPWHSKHKRCPQ